MVGAPLPRGFPVVARVNGAVVGAVESDDACRRVSDEIRAARRPLLLELAPRGEIRVGE